VIGHSEEGCEAQRRVLGKLMSGLGSKAEKLKAKRVEAFGEPAVDRGEKITGFAFQARTKYLQLADKAARTVLMLTERLDHHRDRGQQQIVVKHVTVNADQAMVAETITTAPALQANSQVALDQVIRPALVRVAGGRNRNERQPHSPMQCRSDVPVFGRQFLTGT